MDILGIALGVIGLLLAIWSLWYARVQAGKVADVHRAEMISLWATLDRTRTLLMQIQRITNDQGFVDSGDLTARHKQIIPQIFKGLCDEYVRVAEFIVRKSPGLTPDVIRNWRQDGRLKTEWQEAQFMNLVAASTEAEADQGAEGVPAHTASERGLPGSDNDASGRAVARISDDEVNHQGA